MTLFKSDAAKLAEPPAPALANMVSIDGRGEKNILLKKGDSLSNHLGEIMQGEMYHYVSAGEWSIMDVLGEILKRTGAAKLFIATWTATETQARILIQLLKEKKITELHLLFDNKVPNRTPEMFQLAKYNATRIGVCRCHAKVMVIENDEWHISISGSAN